MVTKDISLDVDLSEFKKANGKSVVCRFRFFDFTDEQRKKLEGAMARPDIASNAIRDVMAEWGFPVPQHHFQKHRDGKCDCPKDA